MVSCYTYKSVRYLLVNRSLYLFHMCFITVLYLVTASNNARRHVKQKYVANGPVYTFVKTDKNANIKWGVRHYIPRMPRSKKFST